MGKITIIGAPEEVYGEENSKGVFGANKSDVINALIQQARETDSIRTHLIKAEQSGFTQQTREQILAEIKAEAKCNAN